MSQPEQKHIVVIGAGVIGLTSALLLQSQPDTNHLVTIIAEHFPAPFETIHPQTHINYSSPWAGAHNRWIPPPPPTSSSTPSSNQASREHALALKTYAHMRALAAGPAGPSSSVRFMKGVEYLEAPGKEYLALDEGRARELGIEGFRVLGSGELPKDEEGEGGGVKWGCEYETWCLDPMVYCCFLLRRFVNRGGVLVRRRVSGVGECFQLGVEGTGDADWNRRGVLAVKGTGERESAGRRRRVDAVVDCSGNGFGDDENMFITRGQTCVVAESGCGDGGEPVTVTRQNADGSWTFSVPRGGDSGTVVGGTREPDNYDPVPCPVLRERLLEKIVAAQPGLLAKGKDRLTPVRDIVGRRPTRRGGPRIEGEVLSVGGKGGREGFVMHAYGMGGRGFELSWGVAEEVVQGVQNYFLTQGRSQKASKL